jgi:hypothetical protein
MLISSVIILALAIFTRFFPSGKTKRKKDIPGQDEEIQKILKSLQSYEGQDLDFMDFSEKISDFINMLGIADFNSLKEINEADAKIRKNRVYEMIEKLVPGKVLAMKDHAKALGVVLEIYYKIPYFEEFLRKVIDKTEEAALTLIDKFNDVSMESKKITREAGVHLENFKHDRNGKSLEDLIEDSRIAMENYSSLRETLEKMNNESLEKVKLINGKIGQVNAALKHVVEISRQNKVIYINLAIEAVKLGDKGKGIKVIVSEIQKLNENTNNFINEIDKIMVSFEEYHANLISQLDRESGKMIEKLENTSKTSEKTIDTLIQSYKSTSQLFIQLNESNNNVHQSVNKIVESLQFQDITRQQIENVIHFLTVIHESIENNKDNLDYFKLHIDDENSDIKEKIRDEFSKKVKVFDEKKILSR